MVTTTIIERAHQAFHSANIGAVCLGDLGDWGRGSVWQRGTRDGLAACVHGCPRMNTDKHLPVSRAVCPVSTSSLPRLCGTQAVSVTRAVVERNGLYLFLSFLVDRLENRTTSMPRYMCKRPNASRLLEHIDHRLSSTIRNTVAELTGRVGRLLRHRFAPSWWEWEAGACDKMQV